MYVKFCFPDYFSLCFYISQIMTDLDTIFQKFQQQLEILEKNLSDNNGRTRKKKGTETNRKLYQV